MVGSWDRIQVWLCMYCSSGYGRWCVRCVWLLFYLWCLLLCRVHVFYFLFLLLSCGWCVPDRMTLCRCDLVYLREMSEIHCVLLLYRFCCGAVIRCMCACCFVVCSIMLLFVVLFLSFFLNLTSSAALVTLFLLDALCFSNGISLLVYTCISCAVFCLAFRRSPEGF